MRVLMTPHLEDFKTQESGIRRVVEAYFKYLPEFGVKLVRPGESFDVHAVHAGMTSAQCDVAMLHGIYWTADYPASGWEYNANEKIVQALRHAKQVTVPAPWVAETIQRDMRFNPWVIPHGIDVSLWPQSKHQGYVLWNKNRRADVCDPTPMMELAAIRSNVQFVTTFMPYNYPRMLNNVRGIGLVKHDVMKKYVGHAAVYLSTTKETFGIGVLEAMASGVPVLGFKWGGNVDLIEHGVNGYLAHPNDIEDLAMGLDYCLKYRNQLGANGRELAKQWSWPNAVEKVAKVYQLAVQRHPYEGKVSVVIPVYNYAHTLERAVNSVLNQTYEPLEIIIVDDGSTDGTKDVGQELAEKIQKVRYIYKGNGGVATARNRGVEESKGEFITCLDADDEIAPKFLEACVAQLRKDRSLGIVYTGLYFVREDGKGQLSNWPQECNYDAHLHVRKSDNRRGLNQIPTCNVFRKEAWERAGGYKQRYAPLGAGAEDAELWARIMSIGYGAKKASDAGLFIYHDGGQVSKPFADGSVDKNLLEPHWLSMHPWAMDKKHPFASRATPAVNAEGKKRLSHAVRQYDQPMVSIVIPVGKDHEEMVKNALDSCEAQTYRQWEAVVVFDNGMEQVDATQLLKAYPYARIFHTPQRGKGAGYARNLGAKHARAPFLVFLDADDMLSPDFLESTLSIWHEVRAESQDTSSRLIVYTDYVQKTITTQDDLLNNFEQQNILQFVEKTGEAVIAGRSAEYDCARAQKQPEFIQKTDPFHWCLVTCLIPKIWHEQIGGFDEGLESFEDVLYHWVMARRGMCYVRVPQQLVMYRMYTGKRRELASIYTEEGRKKAKDLIQRIDQKLEKIEMAGCSKCPGSRTPTPKATFPEGASARDIQAQRAQDEDYVMCLYNDSNRGNHHIYGAVTKEYYGYKGGGAQFLVHRKDIAAKPHLFLPMRTDANAPLPEIQVPNAPVPVAPQYQAPEEVSTDGDLPEYIAPSVEPENVMPEAPAMIASLQDISESPDVETDDFDAMANTKRPFNLDLIPGVTPEIADQLRAKGVTSAQDILKMGVAGLQQVKGIGEVKAEAIIEWLSQE